MSEYRYLSVQVTFVKCDWFLWPQKIVIRCLHYIRDPSAYVTNMGGMGEKMRGYKW